jgi:hypothetical protein
MELLREVVIKTGSIKIKETPQVTELVIFKVDANANVEELLKNFLEFRLIKWHDQSQWVKPLRRYW